MKNIDTKKIFKLYNFFLTIITIISGICLFIGITKNKQALIEAPLLATAIMVFVSCLIENKIIVPEMDKMSGNCHECPLVEGEVQEDGKKKNHKSNRK